MNNKTLSVDMINIKDLVEMLNGIVTKFKFSGKHLRYNILPKVFEKNDHLDALVTLIRENNFVFDRDIDLIYTIYNDVISEFFLESSVVNSKLSSKREIDLVGRSGFYSLTAYVVDANTHGIKVPPYFKLFLEDVAKFFMLDGDSFGKDNIILEAVSAQINNPDIRRRACEVVWSKSPKSVLEKLDYYLNTMNTSLTEIYKSIETVNSSKTGLLDVIGSLSLPNLKYSNNVRYVFNTSYEFTLLLSKSSLETMIKIILILTGTLIISKISTKE